MQEVGIPPTGLWERIIMDIFIAFYFSLEDNVIAMSIMKGHC